MSKAKDYFTTLRADNAMTSEVVTVYANQLMSTAAQELLDHKITGVPVVSYEGRCVGVLSSKDFLTGENNDYGNDQVLDHMTSPPITIAESYSLLEVARVLQSSNIHRVPVVDDRGRVTGILSTRDIVDHTIRAMETEDEN